MIKEQPEILDLIDESDKVIGNDTRENIHLKGLLHRGIIVLVLNQNNELFIQQRSIAKDAYPNYFEGSISGHVLSKENYLQASIRELKEELIIDVAKPLPSSIISREYPPYPVKLCSFRIRTAEENQIYACFTLKNYTGQIAIDKKEIISGKFMKLTEIHQEIKSEKKNFTPVFLEAFQRFKSMYLVYL